MLHYEMMLPHQIRTAIEKRWPVILPLGVLEYHGEHLPVGMDTLAVTGILGILETDGSRHSAAVLLRRRELRGRAAGKQRLAERRRRGSLALRQGDVSGAGAHRLSQPSRRDPSSDGELRRGHADRPRKFAARQAIFAFLEKDRGEGWWGSKEMATTARGNRPARSVQLDQDASADDA